MNFKPFIQILCGEVDTDLQKENIYLEALYELQMELKAHPNAMKLWSRSLGLAFESEKEQYGNVCFINHPDLRDDFRITFSPPDLLDYLLAYLHSASCPNHSKESFRLKLSEVPLPIDSVHFWKWVRLGDKIRKIYLLEILTHDPQIASFPVKGTNLVEKVNFEITDQKETDYQINDIRGSFGRMYINPIQYFDKVPAQAVNFSPGGHRPALEWLTNRMGNSLDMNDQLRYQQIIGTLWQISHLSSEIDRTVNKD